MEAGYKLKNKLPILKWALKNIPIDKLCNPKVDLRYIRSPAFKARIHSSLLSLGIIEPLKVRSMPSDLYEILDGKTRKEDLIDMGFNGNVPCLVTECNDKQALTLQCVLAMIRRNLDPIGMARYVKLKHDEGQTLSQIGLPFSLKKSQISKYLALNKLSPEDKLRVARRELTVDEGYRIASTRRSIPEWALERKVKTKPCPYCGEHVDEVYLAKTPHCTACVERLGEAIKRERKYKQKRF